ncbi:MAG: hypothetical protein WAQ05_20060, partial [Rubrivivax sp.]
MAKQSNLTRVKAVLDGENEGFQNYFSHFFRLLGQERPVLPAILAYQFHLTETAHHRALYGMLCRLHGCDTALARSVIDKQHMTREKFQELFGSVAGVAIASETRSLLAKAESNRDKMIHGKTVTDSQMWSAIFALLDYSVDLNNKVWEIAEFEPFGDMRGSTGKKNGAPL